MSKTSETWRRRDCLIIKLGESIVTHEFSLDAAEEAFETLAKVGNAIKIILKP